MINEIVQVESNIPGRGNYSLEKKREFSGRPEEKVIEGLIASLTSNLEIFGFSKDDASARAANMVKSSGISLEKLSQMKILLLAAAMTMVINSVNSGEPLLLERTTNSETIIMVTPDRIIFGRAFEQIYSVLENPTTILEPIIASSSELLGGRKGKGKRKEKPRVVTGLKNPHKSNDNIQAIYYIPGVTYNTTTVKEERRADMLRYIWANKNYLYVRR